MYFIFYIFVLKYGFNFLDIICEYGSNICIYSLCFFSRVDNMYIMVYVGLWKECLLKRYGFIVFVNVRLDKRC